MSLDARLKQGLANLADPIDVDYELGLVRVTAVARQRERRNVMIAAFAGAAAAIALLAGGGKLADMVLGIEAPLPSVHNPSIEDDRGIDESRFDEDGDGNRVVQDDDLRLDEALDQSGSGPVRGGSGGTERSGESTNVAPPPTGGSQDPATDNHIDAPRDRTASANYEAAGLDAAGEYNCPSDEGPDAGCVEFQARSYERYLSLDINDASGNSVAAIVGIDANRNGDTEDNFEICGSTDGFIQIPAGARIEIHLFADNDSCGAGNSPTRGSITATFSDRLE